VDVNRIAERRSPPPLSGRYAKIILDASERRIPLNLLMFRYEPHQEGPRHKHEGSAEIYFTLRGVGTVKFNDMEYEVKPMSVLYIPPNTTHQPCNYKDEDWIFIAIFVPPINLNEIQKWKIENCDVALGSS
jgi:quercetin dioxygenase-like cupin family protein